MNAYWAVQLVYAALLVTVVLVALRRYGRQTEADLDRLLDDLDRRATQRNDIDAESEDVFPDESHRDDSMRSDHGERKTPAPTT